MPRELDSLINEFLADLSNAGKSKHTVRNYRSDLYRFTRHYGGAIEDLQTNHLRRMPPPAAKIYEGPQPFQRPSFPSI